MSLGNDRKDVAASLTLSKDHNTPPTRTVTVIMLLTYEWISGNDFHKLSFADFNIAHCFYMHVCLHKNE